MIEPRLFISIIIVVVCYLATVTEQQQQQENAWSRDSKDLIRSFQTNQTSFNQNNQNSRPKNQRPSSNDRNNNNDRRFGGGGPSGTGGQRQSNFPNNQNSRPSSDNNDGQSECKLNYHFDYFVLAIQWPETFCLEKLQCNRTIAKQNNWLIHGLWPNQYPQQAIGRNKRKVQLIDQQPIKPNNQQQQPQNSPRETAEYCCGPKYNQSIMYQQNLYNELLKKWPTLHPGNYHHGFWKHEWEKHGTCARNVRPLQNQRKYFETILGLFNSFKLNMIDFENGRFYHLNDVHNKLKKNIGDYKIRLECSVVDNTVANIPDGSSGPNRGNTSNNNRDNRANNNKNRNQQQFNDPSRPSSSNNKQISVFSEIHICLNKSLQPIDCIRRDDYQCRLNNNRILFP